MKVHLSVDESDEQLTPMSLIQAIKLSIKMVFILNYTETKNYFLKALFMLRIIDS